MKAFLAVTRQLFSQLWADAMLSVLMVVPLLMGLLFRFGVPALELFLCARTGRAAVLAAYYPLFDLLLSFMTPVMFTSAGAMVILDEADLGLSRAIAVTPVGRWGYLVSRICVPAVLATVYCAAVTLLFRLSDMDTGRLLLLDLCSGAVGAGTALMIPSMAGNKVEGLAWTKLSGLACLGVPAALLLPAPVKYLAGVLPSLWMTELAFGGRMLNVLPALAAALLWAAAFAGRFLRKVLA